MLYHLKDNSSPLAVSFRLFSALVINGYYIFFKNEVYHVLNEDHPINNNTIGESYLNMDDVWDKQTIKTAFSTYS